MCYEFHSILLFFTSYYICKFCVLCYMNIYVHIINCDIIQYHILVIHPYIQSHFLGYLKVFSSVKTAMMNNLTHGPLGISIRNPLGYIP